MASSYENAAAVHTAAKLALSAADTFNALAAAGIWLCTTITTSATTNTTDSTRVNTSEPAEYEPP